MPGSMKAMVLEKFGHRLRWSEQPIPFAGPEHVLVRVRSCGVCRTDLKIVRGELPPSVIRLPHVPGHECAGEVVEVGQGVTGLKPLDAVVLDHKKHLQPHAEEVFYILTGKGIGGVGEDWEEMESKRSRAMHAVAGTRCVPSAVGLVCSAVGTRRVPATFQAVNDYDGDRRGRYRLGSPKSHPLGVLPGSMNPVAELEKIQRIVGRSRYCAEASKPNPQRIPGSNVN